MKCEICGRTLKSDKSRELGFGPVCYKKVYGSRGNRKKTSSKISKNSAEVPEHYDIPGQMNLEDYLNDSA